jgi:nitrogen regulatory protein P-II 1
MKLISAVVRICQVDAVTASLRKIRIQAFAIADLRDHAPQSHETMTWLGRRYIIGSSLKQEIQLVVHDEDVDETVGTIVRAARTGEDGDGYVCVIPLDHRFDIRTGRRDIA